MKALFSMHANDLILKVDLQRLTLNRDESIIANALCYVNDFSIRGKSTMTIEITEKKLWMHKIFTCSLESVTSTCWSRSSYKSTDMNFIIETHFDHNLWNQTKENAQLVLYADQVLHSLQVQCVWCLWLSPPIFQDLHLALQGRKNIRIKVGLLEGKK